MSKAANFWRSLAASSKPARCAARANAITCRFFRHSFPSSVIFHHFRQTGSTALPQSARKALVRRGPWREPARPGMAVGHQG